MTVRLADWLLDVDIALTMSLSGAQAAEHCSCAYCRNYYQAIDRVCPNLRKFLFNFGIYIEGPDELSPFEPTIYEATYIIQGKILHAGRETLNIDGIPLTIRSEQESDMETEHTSPYFTFCIGLIELPWLLDESPDQVISPANEPEYLARMEKKLLDRIDQDSALS